MPDVAGIAVRFAEAIEFQRARLGLTDAEWIALLRGAEAAAAAAADDMTAAMQRDFAEAILRALEEGSTAAAFRAEYDRIAAEHGWSYHGDAGWHSQLVFRMQTATARAAGRWEQVQRLKGTRPFCRYVTAGDAQVRATHRLWHGVVLPADHSFWRTHWPPNGFNCRCEVQSVNERDLVRFGWSVTADGDPYLQVQPDPGFSGNAGIAWQSLRAR
ncbi:MAG: phage minor head protein [Xanthobacteraceae bacterium]